MTGKYRVIKDGDVFILYEVEFNAEKPIRLVRPAEFSGTSAEDVFDELRIAITEARRGGVLTPELKRASIVSQEIKQSDSCSVEGCDINDNLVKGMCRVHHTNYCNTGDPLDDSYRMFKLSTD